MSLSPRTDAVLKSIKINCPPEIVNLCRSLERESDRRQRVIYKLAADIVFSENFVEDTNDQKISQRQKV
jgi:hypothetical protein